MNKTAVLFCTIGILILSNFLPFSVQAWSVPASTPTSSDGSGPVSATSTGQSKVGGLVLNSGASTYGLLTQYGKSGIGTTSPTGIFSVGFLATLETYFFVATGGKIGIGTVAPASLVTVTGGVQIGNDTETCTTAKAGTLRYHNSGIDVCSGGVWTGI